MDFRRRDCFIGPEPVGHLRQRMKTWELTIFEAETSQPFVTPDTRRL